MRLGGGTVFASREVIGDFDESNSVETHWNQTVEAMGIFTSLFRGLAVRENKEIQHTKEKLKVKRSSFFICFLVSDIKAHLHTDKNKLDETRRN